MLRFSFAFGALSIAWNIIKSWDISVTENKTLEIQINRTRELFAIDFHWRYRQDHAGVHLDLTLLSYEIMIGFIDSRHWNVKEKRFYHYGEDEYSGNMRIQFVEDEQEEGTKS